jgi:hypothetical protein
MICLGQIHSIIRAQWVLSILLLALSSVTSACENSPISLHGRQNVHEQAPYHATGFVDDEEILATGTGATSNDHQYHRHGTKPGMLRARAVAANSSKITTSNPTALSCYSTFSKWRESSMSWAMTAVDAKTWSTTSTITTITQTFDTVATIYPSGSLSTYKLCDGSPRVNFQPLTLTSQYTSATEFDAYITPGLPTYSSTKPCNASSEDCEYLYYNSGLSWNDLALLGLCGAPAHLGLVRHGSQHIGFESTNCCLAMLDYGRTC